MRADAWLVHRETDRRWYAMSPLAHPTVTFAGPFPSWREAYDYAHTHPSNRKETT